MKSEGAQAAGADVPAKDQLHYSQLHILISAYISYIYEKNTTANIEALEDEKLRVTLLASMKVKKSDSSDSDSVSDDENDANSEEECPADATVL